MVFVIHVAAGKQDGLGALFGSATDPCLEGAVYAGRRQLVAVLEHTARGIAGDLAESHGERGRYCSGSGK